MQTNSSTALKLNYTSNVTFYDDTKDINGVI